MSQYHGGPSNHILRWHLVEHSPSILNAPTFCIHVNRAIPHKDIGLKTSLNNLSPSSDLTLAHALITWTKVNLSGLIPFCCICWKTWITLSGCPFLTYFVSFLFHEKNGQLHCAWCHCSHLYCPPWWVFSVLHPNCLLCLRMFEFWVPSIFLQSETELKLISYAFSTSQA